MSASYLIKSLGLAGVSCLVESKYGPSVQRSGPGGLSPLFAATPLILSLLGMFTLAHGMSVGGARTKYMEKAKKDGEKDVEERYGLPNLYAQGTSHNVRAFNCIQRSHQHIFETFTWACLTSTAAALSFPISAAFSTLVYAAGRVVLSKSYANSDGDASKRYSNATGRYMWMGLLSNFALCGISCVKILASTKL
jgi:hypothetical protein